MYHVSYDPVPFFLPRIPKDRLDGEDSTTKRICVAPDIESCINAKAGRGTAIQVSLTYHIPIYLYVYAAEIPREKLILPGKLVHEHGVKDAFLTQEHWLLDAVPFSETLYLVKDAVFETAKNWPSPKVISLCLQEVNSIPQKSAQCLADDVRLKMGTNWTTDFIISVYDKILNTAKGKQLCMDTE